MPDPARGGMRGRCKAPGTDGVFDKSIEKDALMDYCLTLAQTART